MRVRVIRDRGEPPVSWDFETDPGFRRELSAEAPACFDGIPEEVGP
jgi:hypothetical protein